MNARVLRLLVDYFQRTLGVWPLLAMAHVMQLTAFWALHVERFPLLGVIIASLAYFVASESPHAVLRTLPLSRADIALFRWWAGIGTPSLVILLCTSLAWLISGQNGWARPSQDEVTLYAVMACAAFGLLASLPLPNKFRLVWILISVVGFYGVPAVILPDVARKAFIVLGLGLSLAAYVRAWLGRATQVRLPSLALMSRVRVPDIAGLHGWSVLLADVARSTVVLSIIAIVGTSLTRWLYPVFNGRTPLTWLFVAAIAVGASLLMRRWMNAIRSLRVLPIGAHRLTFILYALLIAPGVIACLLTMAAWHVSPRLGLDVPAYMLIVFLIAPMGLMPWLRQRQAAATANNLQAWVPLMQQVAWQIWVGSLSSFVDRLPAGVFVAGLAIVTVGLAITGYFALLGAIRSPATSSLEDLHAHPAP